MKHIPKENIKVSLSVGFLASLQDRHNERYSKHEAFCYLLDKACEHYMPKAVSKEVADELKDFQFVTTKLNLRRTGIGIVPQCVSSSKINRTWADTLQGV